MTLISRAHQKTLRNAISPKPEWTKSQSLRNETARTTRPSQIARRWRDAKVEANQSNDQVETFQYNHEGALVDYIHETRGLADSIIVNPVAHLLIPTLPFAIRSWVFLFNSRSPYHECTQPWGMQTSQLLGRSGYRCICWARNIWLYCNCPVFHQEIGWNISKDKNSARGLGRDQEFQNKQNSVHMILNISISLMFLWSRHPYRQRVDSVQVLQQKLATYKLDHIREIPLDTKFSCCNEYCSTTRYHWVAVCAATWSRFELGSVHSHMSLSEKGSIGYCLTACFAERASDPSAIKRILAISLSTACICIISLVVDLERTNGSDTYG